MAISSIAGYAKPPATRPGMFDGFKAAYARWQERSRIREELMQMTARELADLGLNESDIDDVARGSFRRA